MPRASSSSASSARRLLYRGDRDYREAIKCYRNALRIDQDNMQILRDLSFLQVQMRDLADFVETRRQILTLRPNTRINWIGFAVAQFLSGEHEMALKVIEQYEGTLDDSVVTDADPAVVTRCKLTLDFESTPVFTKFDC